MADTDVLDEPQVETDDQQQQDQQPQQQTPPPPQTGGGDDKTRALYNAASQKFDLGTYDEFKTKLQDPSKRKSCKFVMLRLLA